MKKQLFVGFVLVVAVLLPGIASSFTTLALSAPPVTQAGVWPVDFDAPPQAGGRCSPGLSSRLFGSGHVRGQVLTVQGLAGTGLRVQLLLPDGRIVRETRTDDRGSYRFSDLPVGRYRLQAVDENEKPLAQSDLEIWPEQGLLPVEQSLIVPASNDGEVPPSPPPAPARVQQAVRIQANGYITGVVTAADTGLPLQDLISVEVHDLSGALQASDYADYFTGVYSITVPSGTYKVRFEPVFGDYAPEWYDNQRDFSSATPVVVTDDTVTPNINAALEVGGKITGQVTAAVGGAPIQNVYVRVYTSTTSTSYAAYDTTDASGVYTITGLLTGAYYLMFDPPYGTDYLEEYYNNQWTLAAADGVPVTLGSTTSGIDAALDIGGKITGQVTAATSGTPIQNVYVRAYTSTTSADWDYVAYDATDASGVYTITGLMEGTYYIKFDPPYGSDYLEEYYDNERSLASADGIPVTLNSVVSNTDAALDVGGKITGQVTAAAGGAPIQNVSVYVYTSTTSAEWDYVDSEVTDASGVYTLTNLAESYYYLKFDPSGDFFEEYYNDKPALSSADPISVTLNATVSNVDAALRSASKITGQVTADGSGTPLEDVDVIVYDYGCDAYVSVGWATTDASGMYTVTGLLAGTYRVRFDPPVSGASASYVGEFYNDKMNLSSADPVAVADSSVTSGIDAALALGGQITGRVTASSGGAPLDDVWVDAYHSDMGYAGYGYTDATGVYTITGLPAGNYRVEFNPSNNGASAAFLSEYYNDKTSRSTADMVPVTVGNVTSGIDAALDRGGQITGQVTAADGGASLEYVSVSVYDSDGDWAGSATTNASGVYTTSGLPTGSYRARFSTQSAPAPTEDYIDEYYNDKSTLTAADPVYVTAPNLTSGINAVLARGGKISGRVTAADTGEPLSGIRVSAYDSTGDEVRYDYTDSSGDYTITGLPSGSYRVRFYGVCYFYYTEPRVTIRYAGEYYDDKRDLATANGVTVTAPDTTSGIDAALGGGTISHLIYLPVVLR